jgi:plastocyanin
MTRGAAALAFACALLLVVAGGPSTAPASAQGAATGTIAGRVRLLGPAPANPLIRMGADPRRRRAARGQRPTQEVVLRSADGGLANAFVHLRGLFPAAPAPADPVAIDQRNCLFVPRVVGARVGQTLQITNNDATAHNLHSVSKGNAFNTSQPKQGMVYTFQLKADEVMMRIRCDIHSWMTTYVGVTTHPYFAVSAVDGAFTLARVPAGRHTIQIWHEQYGTLTQTVDVKAGATATVEFSYTGKEKPGATALQEFIVPDGPTAILLMEAR